MIKRLKVFIIVTIGLLVFFQGNSKSAYGKEVIFPELDGMSIDYNYPVYTGEDLWDYINGAADGYQAYHFEQLNIAEYKDGDDNIVKVEIYRHKRPEDAYGIYSTERSPDYHFVDIGAEGYAEKSLTNFVTGHYYVKVIAGAGTTGSDRMIMKISHAVCKSLVEKPELPELLSVFPAEGRLDHSDSFISSNVLGHEFLQDAFKADYEIDNKSFTIMIFKRNNSADCNLILKDYLKYTGESIPSEWKNGLYTVHDKYNGTINFYLQNNVLFGFIELEDKATIDRLTGKILDNLNR